MFLWNQTLVIPSPCNSFKIWNSIVKWELCICSSSLISIKLISLIFLPKYNWPNPPLPDCLFTKIVKSLSKHITNMRQANCSKLSLSSENVPIYVFNNILFHVERKPMRSTNPSPGFMNPSLYFLSNRNALNIVVFIFLFHCH